MTKNIDVTAMVTLNTDSDEAVIAFVMELEKWLRDHPSVQHAMIENLRDHTAKGAHRG